MPIQLSYSLIRVDCLFLLCMSAIFEEGYVDFGIIAKSIGNHFTIFPEMAMKRKRAVIALVLKGLII